MAKPTRTYNPIHFEDLEPKRFEDLVRELIYDFRDWQTIESTGRGGDDDGFDVRAIERVDETVLDDDGGETVHPMGGNVWMIQGKREKEIGPTKLRKILDDVDASSPPYGYILAASVNFSKASFDAFREELVKKGVMEFYLWGKPELEGQLHLPKNDRILFTFFGISNVSRRRSRATEIRFGVTNKNRLYRILGDTPKHSKVLLRDSKDVNYPYRDKYKDFERRPRWRDYHVVEYHPLGLIVQVRENYAYVDESQKQYDIADSHSLVYRDTDTDQQKEEQREIGEKARDYWERLPRRCQARYHLCGLVRYDAMLVVDDKGDVKHSCPHIYVDFQGDDGPFSGFYEYLEVGHEQFLPKDLSEIELFPTQFPAPAFGAIHSEAPLELAPELAERLRRYDDHFRILYDVDGKYDHLAEGDVALAAGTGNDEAFIQVTHRTAAVASKLFEDSPHLKWEVERQVGRELKKNEKVALIEFRTVHRYQFEPRST